MKNCMIRTRVRSRRVDAPCLHVNLCDSCVTADQSEEHEPQIAKVLGGHSPMLGGSCEWCGMTLEEERRG